MAQTALLRYGGSKYDRVPQRMQRSMYNDLSELGQMVRGSNHKTLVMNRGDEALYRCGWG